MQGITRLHGACKGGKKMARRIQGHTRLVTGLYLLEQVGFIRQGFVHGFTQNVTEVIIIVPI